jgi:NAD(P)-dependent dehydrogenase (short-subunit alcohol dehydrogenase family)
VALGWRYSRNLHRAILFVALWHFGYNRQHTGEQIGRKYEKFGSTTVFGRPGQPAELASIYVQLAADDASFATGNIYGAGGGQGQPETSQLPTRWSNRLTSSAVRRRRKK